MWRGVVWLLLTLLFLFGCVSDVVAAMADVVGFVAVGGCVDVYRKSSTRERPLEGAI